MTEALGIAVLHTGRLVMRGPVEADFDAYAAFYAGPRTGFVGGPQDRRTAWRRFAADAGHWALRGFGWWTLTEAGRPVGTAGLHRAPDSADVELGWIVFDGAQGRGLAFEAAGAALGWAAGTLRPACRVISHIDDDNRGSVRLAERLGARRSDARAPHDPRAFVHIHDLERYAA